MTYAHRNGEVTAPEVKQLLPCPFCGGEVAHILYNANIGWATGAYKVTARCLCLVIVEWYEKQSDAIAAWNTRSPIPTPDTVQRHGIPQQHYDTIDSALSVGIANCMIDGDIAAQPYYEAALIWLREANGERTVTATGE